MTPGRATTALALAMLAGACRPALDRPAVTYRPAPVKSEVIGIRQTLTADGKQVQWQFTIVLAETGGIGITFDLAPAIRLPDPGCRADPVGAVEAG